MRNRLLFLVLFAASSLTSFGQITLSQNDIASPGDIIYEQSSAFPTDVPPGGANQSWDFTTVGDSLFLDTLLFKAPSGTPYASVMTGSNLASVSTGYYQFFDKSAAGFYLKGFVFELPPVISLPFTEVPFNITPKIPVLKFPAVYGQINAGTGEGSFEFNYDTTVSGIHITKVKIIATLTLNDTINGWGDAIFAGGTVASLRQTQGQKISFRAQGYTVLPIIGGTWVPLPVTLPSFTSRSVLWWANGKKSPIATFSFDSSGNSTGTTFQRSLLVTGAKENIEESDVRFFPNPAQNSLYWNAENSLKKIQIFSVDGQLIRNQALKTDEKMISLKDLSNGLYWVKSEAGNGIVAWKKLIINK